MKWERIIIGVLIVIIIYLFYSQADNTLEEHKEKENAELQSEIDSLKGSIKNLRDSSNYYKSVSDSVKIAIKDKDKKIIKLSKRKNEKIRSIDNLNNDELVEFFSEFEAFDSPD